MDKKPIQFRASWRMAVSEVNLACKAADLLVKKGAEITLALLPNMLLRAPSAAERLQSMRVKMGTTFGKFFAGHFMSLVDDITKSSVRTLQEQGLRVPRSHVYSEEAREEKVIFKAEKLTKEGFISKAVRTLETLPPAPGTQETFEQLQAHHSIPTEPVISAIPSSTPRNTFILSDKARTPQRTSQLP
jgi:hypothetical protein